MPGGEEDAADAAAGAGGAAGTAAGVGGTAGTAAGAGGAGGSAGSAGGTPDDSDSGVEESDTTPPGGEVVLPTDGEALSVCFKADECNGDDLVCAVFGAYRGYCAEDCTVDDDCATIDGIQPACESGQCVIDCVGGGEGDGRCPDNMVCGEIAALLLSPPIYRCQYPEEKDGEVYDVCDPARADANCKQDLSCQMFPGLTDLRDSMCVAGCTEAAECSAFGSSATPVCDPGPLSFFDGICALDCVEDDDCPDDLTCVFVDLLTNRCGHSISRR